MQSLGCLWVALGLGGSGEGSDGRGAILHGAVVDPAGFRSSSRPSPTWALHAADAGGMEKFHPLPGSKILGTGNAMNHDGHTPHPRGSVASNLVQEG